MAIQSNFPAIKPSLLLDFANTKQLDSRITYTRASTASFYNGVTTAMAEQNLLTYSQEFDNAAWSKFNSTVTANSVAAPDGTTTAETLTANSSTSGHNAGQSITLISGTTYTASVYAKKNTLDYINVYVINTSSASAFASVAFNLNTGAVASSNANGTGFAVVSSSITSVGNGWYRCVLVATYGSLGASPSVGIALNDDGTTPNGQSGGKSFAGTSTESVYIWGAQLEQRSAVTAYTATTTQAITNYIPVLQTAASGVARFDNNPTTGESLGLLIEESRTNLFTYSSDFSNAAWSKIAASVTANTIVAPDGTLTGGLLIPNTTSAEHRVEQAPSVSAGSNTFTVYGKYSGQFLALVVNGNGRIFDLVNGVSTAAISGGANSFSITPVGNGWYRCSITVTLSAGVNYPAIISTTSSTSSLSTGNGFSGVFIWGAQLEAGAFATSYIPTVASQVTRAADAASMTGTNFSTWYNAGEGTFYGEASSLSGSAFRSLLRAIDNSTANNIFEIGLITGTNNGVGRFQVSSNGASQWDTGNASTPAFVANTFYKLIAGSKVNDFAGSRDSGTVATDTAGTVANNLATFEIGGRHLNSSNLLNGTIKKIAYYPLRVTNAQLQALTS
jgi:hypothetical protein